MIMFSIMLLALTPSAPTSTPTAAVLHQSTRWLNALMKGDRRTIDAILAPNYKHVDSNGALIDRNQELAGASKPAPPMKWTDETVDFAGDVAVVHGLNTMTESGKTVRERFTDVYVYEHGTWLAIAAHESKVAQ